jgi:GT2 family glycosyltransferase
MTKKKIDKSIPLDVVVTTAGRYDILEKCLESLGNQTVKTFNICLIDGNDDIPERNKNQDLLKMHGAKMLGQNVGFPRLANEGARMGAAPLILFLSDDVLLDENAIELMINRMKDETIGILGAKLLFPEDSAINNRPAGKVQHIGLAMDAGANILHPLIGWSADNPKTCISRDVFATTGACFLIRRNLFRKSNGFDEDFGLGTFEDVAECLFVKTQGKRVFVDTDIIGHHYVGATAEKKQIAFPLMQNSMILKAKWAQSGLFVYDSWEYY